jgi:acyl carrier protein
MLYRPSRTYSLSYFAAHYNYERRLVMNNTLVEQIRQIAADIFGEPIGKVQIQSSTQTLQNWDSLAHLNLILALEESFQCEISPEEAEKISTVGDAVRLIEQKLG